MNQTIKFTKHPNKRKRPDTPPIFGTVFTNYMFQMKYNDKEGWHDPEIKPYESLALDPSALCLHYGQTIFEGMKVIKVNGKRVLFRPDENFKRLNKSAQRMCIPEIDPDFALEALVELIKAEDDEWFYENDNSSIYIRPFIIATESVIGAKISKEYLFMIIMTPMTTYFTSDKVKLTTETHFMRVAANGTGEAKNGGNYGGAFYATDLANDKGYEQILWLDPLEQKYVEEAGMMNVFFVVNDKIITPMLNGSILKGITRDSVINVAPDLGYEVEEKRVDINELIELYKNGELTEAFASGTAASIQPLDIVNHKGFEMKFSYDESSACNRIYKYLDDLKNGTITDTHDYVITF